MPNVTFTSFVKTCCITSLRFQLVRNFSYFAGLLFLSKRI